MNKTTIPEGEIREAWNARLDVPCDEFTHGEWMRMVEGEDEEVPYRWDFRAGYLACAAKHAEEVAKKDAEIKRLNVELDRGWKELKSRGEKD